jgi:O-antigen ligase/polysaccharide polymerase Wzy-like membrane protein
MGDSIVSFGMGALTVVAALILFSALRKSWARAEWTGTTKFGFAMVMLTVSTVEIFVTFFGLWTKSTNAYYKSTVWAVPDIAHLAMQVLILLLGLFAAVVFVLRFRRGDTVINLPAVLFLLMGIVSAESALLHGDNPFRPLSAVFLAVVGVCTVAPRGLGIHLGVGTACMIVAIASGLTFIIHRDFSVFPCTADSYTADKCGLLGFNFRGILENANAMAMFLTLAVPFVYIGFGSWQGPVLSAYTVGLILLTGGRSGMIASAVTLAALIILRPNIRNAVATPVRSGLLYAGLAVLVAVGIGLPFVSTDPTAFHGRASLWMMARNGLSEPMTLLYGTGMLGWQHVRDSGMIDPTASYSVHNEWLQVLYSTGIVGSILFLSALGLLLWQARPKYSLVVGSVLIPVFVLAVTERPWPIDTCDWLIWAIPATLLSYPAVRRQSAEGTAKPGLPQPKTVSDALDDESSGRTWRAELKVAT